MAIASSYQDSYHPNSVTDENAKTYWLAQDNTQNQWLQVDLENVATVYALQINYHDHLSNLYGRIDTLKHRYLIQVSDDNINWQTIVDKRNSYKDSPNAYIELEIPTKARYVRYLNISIPTPNLAISGFRIFGIGSGKAPTKVKKFNLHRHQSDRRDVMIKWNKVPNAQGYNIRWGIAPDKLYSTWMVYDNNELLMKSLTVDQSYYFAIESFNENGVSQLSDIIFVP